MNASQNDITVNLSGIIPPAWLPLFHLVGREGSNLGLKVFLVGGSVRDLFLGYPITDLDFVMEGDAIQFARHISGKYGGKVKVHNRFGTATWSPDGSDFLKNNLPDISVFGRINLDFITARSERYKTPASLPAVKPGILKDDLQRRDFSINTLAMSLSEGNFGEVVDELGGLEDLEKGLIRVLHQRSFIDDPTRLFRALRYEQRYHFRLFPGTENLIPAALKYIDNLSAARVRHELDLIMEEEDPAGILNRLSALGILAGVHPALGWNENTSSRMKNGLTTLASRKSPGPVKSLGWALWLMATSPQVIQEIDERLHFSGEMRRLLQDSATLFSNLNMIAGGKPSQCVAGLERYSSGSVQAVYVGLVDGPEKGILEKYLTSWRYVKPKTTGRELIDANLSPGPAFQEILSKIRDAWLDGNIGSYEEEKLLLKTLLAEYAKR